jgi:endo-1,4-beta-xylanase
MRLGLLLLTLITSALSAADSLKQATPWASGVGISDRIPDRPEDWPLLTKQFSYVTPENCMKPVATQPNQGQWQLGTADRFVAFAQNQGLKVVGHCLVWAKDDRTPPWFYQDGNQPASKEVLLARMKAHIDQMVGRYRGKIAMWDVVNEALADGGGYLRDSGWSRTCGIDFIVKAFEYAHAADPDALLVYNDYNNELDGKREQMLKLLTELKARGTPLQAVGLQGHYEIDRVPFEAIEKTLIALKALGLKVVVSELDIDVIPRGRWWADNGSHHEELSKLNPYPTSCPPEILNRQAEQYAQLFKIFRHHSDTIARISFWNLHDGQSWLNDFPWKRTNYPLLFDRQGQPKPAFHAVMKELASEPTAPPTSKIPPQPRKSWSAINLNPDDVPAFPNPPSNWATWRPEIPHGKLEMISYESKTVGTRRRLNVYTPPNFKADQKYPVLYLLHGIGGDETEWARYASPEILLDNLIAEGKAAPMIIVMPNGRAQKDDRAIGDIFSHIPAFQVFERDLLDDIIPAIEAKYSVRTDRTGRALAGLSMGGGQTMNIGFAHLDKFAWLGAFSSGPNARKSEDLLPDPAAAKDLRLLWLSCGKRDGLLHVSQDLHAYMKANSVAHVWHVTDHAHDAPEWKQALYWFVQQLKFN